MDHKNFQRGLGWADEFNKDLTVGMAERLDLNIGVRRIKG